MTLAVRQGTPEWLAARRSLVTATDIPVLLGLSPYKCEADLADEKAGAEQPPATLRMRAGLVLQDLIGEAYTEQTGKALRRFRGLSIHPTIEWAAASPDFRVVGERRLVEAKRSASRSRFADGLPQDVEAQVAWQLGVTGYPAADVAVLLADDELVCFEVEADPDLFADLVTVAEDFRRRLEAGGPFAESDESLRKHYPRDNGVQLPATPDLVELVEHFRAAKAAKAAAENAEKSIGSAIRTILLDASGIEGLVTYRKSADSTRVNWPAVASAYRTLLADRPADELDVIESIHSETVQGPRVLRLLKGDRSE
jgi:putative phage-type endonuclease